MASLKINVEQVSTTANKIKDLNIKMNDRFSDVQNSINRLDIAWDGAAAINTISKFNAIKNSYCDARYNVLDNFVAFLHKQVGNGYIQTENINISLASQFK